MIVVITIQMKLESSVVVLQARPFEKQLMIGWWRIPIYKYLVLLISPLISLTKSQVEKWKEYESMLLAVLFRENNSNKLNGI